MTEPTRRALAIDDPAAGRDACHVAHSVLPEPVHGQVRRLALGDIRPNPSQPRKQFDEAALAGLANSIRERGVLQPIIVRPTPSGGFELVAGERRWRAARIAGRLTIPALIDANVEGAGTLELTLIENVVREDLTSRTLSAFSTCPIRQST
ncbi:MAG: ParB/RepB/Spo0J family partition protein [Actinomycetota bacterium]|nr:ParB/RepB/Spo0J family partition protein [Actinomycetota bacterium]